jgi:ribose transport system permease protein
MNTMANRPTEASSSPRSFVGGMPTRAWAVLGPARWILVMLVVLLLVFSAIKPTDFPTGANVRNIGVDASVLLVLAIGQTFVIATAGIDLSVGSVLVFAGVIAAKVMSAMGGDGGGVFVVGLALAIATGLAWGAVNGFLIARANIPPLIATLGTLGAALGAAFLLSNGLDINAVPRSVTDFGIANVGGGVPVLLLVAAVIALAAGVVLGMTRFGRYTLAIGSNPEAARRGAIAVRTHLFKVYAYAGGLSGLAGFLGLARFGTTSINGHLNDNLQAITAVAIGGTSLFGGVASVLGSTVGVLIPSVLNNGFVIANMQPFWQQIAVAVVLVGAVYFDQRRRSRH